MNDPKIKVKVIHSSSKNAWNIVGRELGKKWKIARIPYDEIKDCPIFSTKLKAEALNQAEFIAYCFNNSSKIINN